MMNYFHYRSIEEPFPGTTHQNPERDWDLLHLHRFEIDYANKIYDYILLNLNVDDYYYTAEVCDDAILLYHSGHKIPVHGPDEMRYLVRGLGNKKIDSLRKHIQYKQLTVELESCKTTTEAIQLQCDGKSPPHTNVVVNEVYVEERITEAPEVLVVEDNVDENVNDDSHLYDEVVGDLNATELVGDTHVEENSMDDDLSIISELIEAQKLEPPPPIERVEYEAAIAWLKRAREKINLLIYAPPNYGKTICKTYLERTIPTLRLYDTDEIVNWDVKVPSLVITNRIDLFENACRIIVINPPLDEFVDRVSQRCKNVPLNNWHLDLQMALSSVRYESCDVKYVSHLLKQSVTLRKLMINYKKRNRVTKLSIQS